MSKMTFQYSAVHLWLDFPMTSKNAGFEQDNKQGTNHFQ